jgi:hypothetical protein
MSFATGGGKSAAARLLLEETNAAMRGKPRWAWAPVPGARHLVACDHGGLILAHARRINGRREPGGLLTPAKTGKSRYWQVKYTDDEGRPRKRPVGVVVLEAHVGPRPQYTDDKGVRRWMECCHNDGDLNNNDRGNLRWDTHAANRADRWGSQIAERAAAVVIERAAELPASVRAEVHEATRPAGHGRSRSRRVAEWLGGQIGDAQ